MDRLRVVNERADPGPAADPDATFALCAQDLLRGRRSVRIVLGDQTYVLRVTRAGKLILTK